MRAVVLQGGPSSEAEVSRKSGARVFKALKEKGFDAVQTELDEQVWEKLKRERPDIVFIALHGKPGEDGSVQGMLELLTIPYTGSGVAASAIGIDKRMTKDIFLFNKIPTPKGLAVNIDEAKNLSDKALIDRTKREAGWPCVVKPNAAGSTIGLSVVKNQRLLRQALDLAFEADNTAIIEQYVIGTEVTVGLLGNYNPIALPVIEISSTNAIYDYEAKYTQGLSRHIIPARIPKKTQKRLQALAVKAHDAIGCRGFSRVDFIVRGDEIFTLEINTIPGLTELSLFPDAAKAAGISTGDLVARIVCLALENC